MHQSLNIYRHQYQEMIMSIAALDGLRLPGGCTDCNADQELSTNWGGAGIHRITIHHDEWCPRINTANRTTRRATRRSH